MFKSRIQLGCYQKQFANYLLQPEVQAAAALQAWLGSGPDTKSTEGRRIDAGLRVYRNNVLYSLTQALAAQYPVVQRLVGADFFQALAADYVRQEPPLDPSLTYYGHLFADFIVSAPACRPLPYLADVATLELQCQRALHAADDPDLDLRQLGALPPEQLANARFALHASALLFTSAYAVDRIWAANIAESDEVIQLDAQALHHMLIYRRGFEVQVVSLQTPAFALLQQLQAGSKLQHACDHVQQQHGIDDAELAPLLGYLLGLQVFSHCSLQTTTEHP